MKKIILMLMVISAIFISCNKSTTIVKVISPDGIESTASFEEFFNFEIIIKNDNDDFPLKIMMDKNTQVLYVMYIYGISPIYDLDGSVMTKEKWLVKHVNQKLSVEE